MDKVNRLIKTIQASIDMNNDIATENLSNTELWNYHRGKVIALMLVIDDIHEIFKKEVEDEIE